VDINETTPTDYTNSPLAEGQNIVSRINILILKVNVATLIKDIPTTESGDPALCELLAHWPGG
jgi:hypothetical protein